MFTPLSLGTNHMFGQDNWVPLTNNNFEIRIYRGDGSSPTENADLLTLTTNDIGEIVEEEDVITIHYGNGIIKFPAKVSFSDVDWTLNCYCEPNVIGELRKWRAQVYDPATERMGLPTEYMRTAYFIKYDGRGQARDIIKCPGVWPRGLQNGSHNQSGSEIVQVKTTLVISKAIYLTSSDF